MQESYNNKMIELRQQQIVQKYKFKMQILVRVLVITICSTLLVILLLDKDSPEAQLSLSSKINCIDINSNGKNFICNSCFRVPSKSRPNEKIRMQSQTTFMAVSLKPDVSGIFRCEEWLQTVDYELFVQDPSIQRSLLRIQPTVLKFLKAVQSEHNQILQVHKIHEIDDQKKINSIQTDIWHPYQVVFYFAQQKDFRPIKVFLTNEAIRVAGIHIIKILALAGFLAVGYLFHCAETKNIVKKYKKNLFSVVGLIGVLMLILFKDFNEEYLVFLVFCKVIFLSLVLDTIFDRARWICFGIVFIINLILILLNFNQSLIAQIINLFFLAIITIKVGSDAQKQYFHLTKNSKRKIYSLASTYFMMLVQFLGYYFDEKSSGKQIMKFLTGFLSILTFLICVKNLDGDKYTQILKEQTKNQLQNNSYVEETFENVPSNSITQQSELQQIKR